MPLMSYVSILAITKENTEQIMLISIFIKQNK